MEILFSSSALRQLEGLDFAIQGRILNKLDFFAEQKKPLTFAERIIDSSYGDWRFRIGDYRVIFDVEKDIITILKIGHRREIYR